MAQLSGAEVEEAEKLVPALAQAQAQQQSKNNDNNNGITGETHTIKILMTSVRKNVTMATFFRRIREKIAQSKHKNNEAAVKDWAITHSKFSLKWGQNVRMIVGQALYVSPLLLTVMNFVNKKEGGFNVGKKRFNWVCTKLLIY